MRYVVLDSFLGSQYDDSPTEYRFPSRYLREFEPLSRGEPLFAIIYEPRGDRNTGRIAYVGFAMITHPPEPIPSGGRRGAGWWVARYDGRAYEFSKRVPREFRGEPLEAMLRGRPRGRLRNVATLGRAVRSIDEADALRILELGRGLEERPDLVYPLAEDLSGATSQVHERAERLVSVVQRDARFRDGVLVAYEQRCAVSGFTIGSAGPSQLSGLIDAAHIRPVEQDGPDDVSNGLALTPTLHRLLDKGLFTLRYEDASIRVRVSPRLEESMVSSPDGSFRMPLSDGLIVRLPTDPTRWPHPDQLRYHEHEIFIASPV